MARTTKTQSTMQTTETLLKEITADDRNGGRTYHEILAIEGFKVQISIYVESYKFQQHAIIQVWQKADLTWQSVANIPTPIMQSCGAYCRVTDANFRADRDELVRRFRMIVL
jgi:hypothetical protein